MSCQAGCLTCALLQAALLQVIGERAGSDHLVERVCARAGLAEAEFKTHYSSGHECLVETYERVVGRLVDEYATAFAQSGTWTHGLELGTQRMLARLAERPNEAWLCFVEVLRGGRELLRRRDNARHRLVRLFAAEHRRREDYEHPSDIQHEMLIGMGFRVIAAHVADGRAHELPALGSELAALVELFAPVPV